MTAPRGAAVALFAASAAIVAFLAPTDWQAAYVPQLEPRRCDWKNRSGRDVVCYVLVVPENRERPAGRKVRLPVVVFRSPTGGKTSPVVFINGGPGVHTSTAGRAAQWWNRRLKQISFIKGRNLVIYDQRGVGAARPALECPGVKATRADPLNAALLKRVLKSCADRFRAQGVDLSAYDTRTNVADLIDLQRALKIKRWNLWGQSYGSRIALEVMRQHPSSVRSAILDGPYPPHIGRKFNWARPTLAMIDRILARCAGAEACRTRIGDPGTLFARLLRRMRQTPVSVVSNPGGKLPTMTYRINDVMLMWVIQDALYTSTNIRKLPALIAALAAPDPDKRLLSKLVEDYDINVYGPYYSHGAAYAVSCNDNPNPDKADERRIATERPFLKPWIDDMLAVDGCAYFSPGAKGTMNFEPVKSRVPTLVIAGGLDLATPPEWARETAKHLPNSTVYVFRYASHDVSDRPCAQALMFAFLARPEKKPILACTSAPSTFTFDWGDARAPGGQ